MSHLRMWRLLSLLSLLLLLKLLLLLRSKMIELPKITTAIIRGAVSHPSRHTHHLPTGSTRSYTDSHTRRRHSCIRHVRLSLIRLVWLRSLLLVS